jgi:hypothetical protein
LPSSSSSGSSSSMSLSPIQQTCSISNRFLVIKFLAHIFSGLLTLEERYPICLISKKKKHYCMAMLVSDMDVLATTKYKGVGLTTRQQATPRACLCGPSSPSLIQPHSVLFHLPQQTKSSSYRQHLFFLKKDIK